jgi:pyruvate dehydrogenase E1 component
VTETLGATEGPILAVTDFMKAVPDQVGRFVPQPFIPLGTDGFGFSDTRNALRRHFEVDAPHVVVGVLSGLAQTGDVKGEVVAEAIRRYDLDPERPDPRDA